MGRGGGFEGDGKREGHWGGTYIRHGVDERAQGG